jgi:uroporphyrinogen decarboxylase
MTPRERYVKTLLFAGADRIPFSPGDPRESTLAAWRKQGLPAGADWSTHVCQVLGIPADAMLTTQELGVDFRLIPRFEEQVLERGSGHLIVQDWKGNICEIPDRYDVSYLRTAKDFVTRRWIRCPVNRREDWEQMQRRYDAGTPSRFPPDFERQCGLLRDRHGVLTISIPGPFWQMREWCGFEGLCIMMARHPDLVSDMAAFWSDFVAAMLARILPHVVPDAVVISEDMAYKARAMISPAMTREFCLPSWRRWSARLRAAGCQLIAMDCDGFIEDLVPLWIESGINVCEPVEVAALNDIVLLRRRFGQRMAYRGGVDKRAIAQGGPIIRQELKRIGPVVRDGGFIPGCDHAVPPDVSWSNYLEYCRLLGELTGWL